MTALRIGDKTSATGGFLRIKDKVLWEFGNLHLEQSRQVRSNRVTWAMPDVTDYSGRYLLNMGWNMQMRNGVVSVFVEYSLLPVMLFSDFPNSYNISIGNN